jgi:hypothetical protein
LSKIHYLSVQNCRAFLQTWENSHVLISDSEQLTVSLNSKSLANLSTCETILLLIQVNY